MKYCNHPESKTVFSKLLFLLFLVLLLILLSSCKTTSNTTAIVPVHSATHDTIFLRKLKYSVLRQSENSVSLPPPQRYSL